MAEKEKISEADLKDHILITEGGDDRLKTWSGKVSMMLEELSCRWYLHLFYKRP